MDADRFDALLRSLSLAGGPSRRAIVRTLVSITLSGALGAWVGLADADARRNKKKRKRKQKRRRQRRKTRNAPSGCTPNCAGKVCGSDGCGGSCGACPECETCANGRCVPESPGTACSGGACRSGSCQACGEASQTCCAGNSCTGGAECWVDTCCRDLACGAQDQACCADGACDEDLHCVASRTEGTRCVPETTPCGGDGEDCCFDETGFTCGSNLVCDLATVKCGDGTTCGGTGEGCCVDGSAVTCDPGLQCDVLATCVASCGAEGESCCAIDPVTFVCDGELVCTSRGICAPSCGGAGEPCCAGGCGDGCDGSLTCNFAISPPVCQEP